VDILTAIFFGSRYLFFLLLMFFFSYLATGWNKASYLAISGISMSVAESIRYEASVVFGALIVILGIGGHFGFQVAKTLDRLTRVADFVACGRY